MEKKLRQTLLYDFYGELLTAHQKEIYEDFVLHDLGLSEIAAEEGISRQGVHDLIRRCDRILEDYEKKLRLLERFLKAKGRLEQIRNLALNQGGQDLDVLLDGIRELSDAMMEEL